MAEFIISEIYCHSMLCLRMTIKRYKLINLLLSKCFLNCDIPVQESGQRFRKIHISRWKSLKVLVRRLLHALQDSSYKATWRNNPTNNNLRDLFHSPKKSVSPRISKFRKYSIHRILHVWTKKKSWFPRFAHNVQTIIFRTYFILKKKC
jgi:hypothetical protein